MGIERYASDATRVRVGLEFVKNLFNNKPQILKYTRLNDKDLIEQQFIRDPDSQEWSEVSAEEVQRLNDEKRKKPEIAFNNRPPRTSKEELENDIEAAEALLAKLKAKIDFGEISPDEVII